MFLKDVQFSLLKFKVNCSEITSGVLVSFLHFFTLQGLSYRILTKQCFWPQEQNEKVIIILN